MLCLPKEKTLPEYLLFSYLSAMLHIQNDFHPRPFFPCAVQGDFIALELKGGRVVFRFGSNFETLLALSTRFTYNTNKWVWVSAARSGRQGPYLTT